MHLGTVGKCRLCCCSHTPVCHMQLTCTALPLEPIVSRGWSRESAGLAGIWVAEQLTALLRCSFWAISISDHGLSQCIRLTAGFAVSILGGRERRRAVSSAWLAVGAGRRAPRESSTSEDHLGLQLLLCHSIYLLYVTLPQANT